MRTCRLAALHAAPFLLWSLALPSSAQAEPDACQLLTPAQVGSALGVPVAAGTHVTPTYVKTCTWNATSGSNVKFVTLFLQAATAYDGGKKMANQMAATAGGAAFRPAAVGDDAYYFVAGDQVGLLVKKGSLSFKVTVYATLPVDRKEAIELTLAKEVVAKL